MTSVVTLSKNLYGGWLTLFPLAAKIIDIPRVVTNDETRNVLLSDKPLLKPLDRRTIQLHYMR